MARKFLELEAKMSPESRTRVEEEVRKTLAETLNIQQPAIDNEFLGSLHETAVDLHKIGVIGDAEMREYDRNCIDRANETISNPSPLKNSP
jgi:7-cyano-7-deazaguanine synthase in queuosine biosynthesis